ncbi:hypothetical protein [Segeticoccus rhizosphaerae]|uniref:hypothetical protein n=1 Tax=Segeticoccus rhizosphaerae TaxID=1104777 RepID=UPI001264A002|nr:hypothetical protein [Segeticoccus rhizosphaerae]
MLVLYTVDLDDHAVFLPLHVEVGTAARSTTHDLPARLGQAAFAAQPREVELTERLHPRRGVPQYRLDDPATGQAQARLGIREQVDGPSEALLAGHQQDQRGLPIGVRPGGGADRCHDRLHPRDPDPHDVLLVPRHHLVHPQLGEAVRVAAMLHAQVQRLVIPTQSGGGERGGPVEHSARADLEHRLPPLP